MDDLVQSDEKWHGHETGAFEIAAAWLAGPFVWVAVFVPANYAAGLLGDIWGARTGAIGAMAGAVACTAFAGMMTGRRVLLGGLPPLLLAHGFMALVLHGLQRSYGVPHDTLTGPLTGLAVGVFVVAYLKIRSRLRRQLVESQG